ncbi:PilW family protein [Massilia niastensis]|uniref:PilW family protein n=1 Tax=Massilia niastensis TaxID=544911 RepID=UPI000366AECB|nr:PilW family protein [Massilia niastensis]
MKRGPILNSRAAGFSLVELMVSVVIGLLAVLFATRIMTGSEQTKDAALGSSDSMQNGMLAMFSISADAEQAGYGLNDPLINGCDTRMTDANGYQLAPAQRGGVAVRPLAPAVIEPGGAGSDRVTLYAGSASSGTATLRLTADYIGGTRIDVDRVPFGFRRGDVIAVVPEKTTGAGCALAQISNTPEDLPGPPALQYLMIGGAGLRYNSGSLGAAFTGGAARLFNLGPEAGLAFHTWSVEDGYLRLRATNMAGAGAASQAVADNIVSLKAQYGFDTRAEADFVPEEGVQVGRWSSDMLDADGDGVSGGAGDYQRIAALRIAVVARARNPERPDAKGACSATLEQPTVFASEQPQGVAAAPVEVEVEVEDDPIAWSCYRYRVFETIVPLRNAGWRPSA